MPGKKDGGQKIALLLPVSDAEVLFSVLVAEKLC